MTPLKIQKLHMVIAQLIHTVKQTAWLCANLCLVRRFNETIIIIQHVSYTWSRRVQKILEELLSTEREYVKALAYVREHYFPELERADVPQDLRGQRGSIFGNLEKLHDFHRHHFLDELESCVVEPFRVGRSFLRHVSAFSASAEIIPVCTEAET